MCQEKQNYARVKVENESEAVIVPISTKKPEIPEEVQEKWQKIVNLVARIIHVPTGLITRLTATDLEIFIASKTEGNPYKKNDKDRLGIGMFCETVAGRRREMMVTDTESSDYWRKNPHAGLGMHAYLGIPIQWEDGELFGTFCMLDDKSNQFTVEFQDLIRQFKEIIETDLKVLLLQEQMAQKLSKKEFQLREVHHRIKNHFNFLISFLRIQSRGLENEPETQQILKELQNRIHVISLIHDELQHSEENAKIPLAQYIPKLCNYMIQHLSHRDISIKYAIDPLMLTPEPSVSIGYIVSELITNSMKHAFKDTGNPEINIRIEQTDPEKIRIQYHDNGSGLPESFTLDESRSAGTLLLKSMIQQMNGDVKTASNSGADFLINLNISMFEADHPS